MAQKAKRDKNHQQKNLAFDGTEQQDKNHQQERPRA